MKVMLTGATGFIGSYLTKYLAAEQTYELFALLHSSSGAEVLADYVVEQFPLDRPDRDLLSVVREAVHRAQPEVIAHLAALVQVQDEPDRTEDLIEANITLGTCLLQAASEEKVKGFVATGTFSDSMDRADTYRPLNLYAATKRAFEDILRYYADAYGIKAVTLKLFGTFGPNDPRPKVFNLFEKSIDAPEPIRLSPGAQVLDLLHVHDVARAYEKAIQYVARKETPQPETFEIGSGEKHTLRELAGIYEDACGQTLHLAWGKLPYRSREVYNRYADLRAAKEVMGWQPSHDFRTWVRKMIEESPG